MNEPCSRVKSFAPVLTICVGLVIGRAACADDNSTPSESPQLDPIVVTAQKREQSIQDVGTSITAFTSSELNKLGIQDVTDIVSHVPGLQFNQFSPTITVFNLRGVSQNDFSDHQEGPVAVYSDEAYVASMGAIAGSLYDLERVEVLRGPQGTLFGRNATGGLVQFISKEPAFDEEGYAQATAGSFHELNTEGAINTPINDALASRFSFATNYHDGLISNRIGPDSENQKQYAAREQLRFKIGDSGEYLLKLYGISNYHEAGTNYSWAAAYQNAQGLGTAVAPNQNPWGTCNGCDLSGYRNPSSDPFNQAYGRPGAGLFDRTLYGATGKLVWNFDGATLSAISNFQHLRKRYGEDTDESPNFTLWYDTFQRFLQFSQELRLNGKAGPLQWVTGLYYFNSYSDDSSLSRLPDAFGGPAGNQYNIKTFSYAGFAQMEWALADQWTLSLGGRLTEDQKIDNYVLYSPSPQFPIMAFNTSTNPDLANQRWLLPSGKVELDYKVQADSLLYGSVSRGVKAGGFAQPGAAPGLPADRLPFQPEKLTSYEIGSKNLFFDGRARANAAIFYYDYQNYQAFEQLGLVQVIANLHSYIRGGEIETAVVPFQGLEIELGASTLSTTLANVTLPSGQIADRYMPEAPKWSLNGSAQYKWAALASQWSIEVDAKTETPFYFSTFNNPDDREPGHTVGNARIGYENAAGNISVTAFCKNFTDKQYRIYAGDVSSLGFINNVYAAPRWFGATVNYKWH